MRARRGRPSSRFPGGQRSSSSRASTRAGRTMPATRTATRSALWLTEELPGHDLGGGSIRQARLFEAMAQEFATDLWVVGELEDERVRDAAARVVELPKGRALWSDRRLMRRLLQIGLAFASRLPGGQIYFARPGRRALAGRLR